MDHFEAFVFWNPWWNEEQDWVDAVERDALADLEKLFGRKEILTLTGVRRSGKTTILHLLIKSLLGEGIPPRNILHLNLEDPAFKGLTIQALYEKYLELMVPEGALYLFLDEVQEVNEWQRELRRLYDGAPHIKFVITGSNSSLLTGEYATLLTGRTLRYEVSPFSFREFAKVRSAGIGFERHQLLRNKPRLQHLFSEYLHFGGFPEVVREPDKKIKSLLLKEYYNAILTRDVLRRYPVRQTDRYEAAAHYLLSNATSPFSAKKLAPLLGITQHTLEEYLGYLEDVYLFFTVKHFSYSVKQQITYPRKIYSIDTGFINAVSFRFSADQGKTLENLVLAALKAAGKECYYWKGKKECDFVLMAEGAVSSAIQVCHSLVDPATRKREVDGLLEAMHEFNLPQGLILTAEESDAIQADGRTISVMPVWSWLLTGF